MAVTQYIGARYVPKFYENSDGTEEWRAGVEYEPLTIVTYNGNSYTSKKPVPSNIGNPSDNTAYWVSTGNFNAQLAEIQTEVAEMKNKTDFFVTPEQYGAVGDGVTNDSAAVNAAIGSGRAVFFNPDKTYRADIITPNDRYVDVDFNGSVIVGSITVTTTLPNINYSDKNRHFFRNGNIRATSSVAILVQDDNYRTVIENMTITALRTGIQCGVSGTRPSDVHIINCFINAAPGNEDETEYGINCVGTDNKISGCLIYGFMTCIKCKSLEVIENCHFLYRGDFSTHWSDAVAIECQNSPSISNCYFDTYKKALKFSGNCYPNISNMIFYSWREDTGNINGLIDFNGHLGYIKINGATINVSNVTSFKTLSLDFSNDANASVYINSEINGIFCSRWGAVYDYDVLRKAIVTNYYNNSVAGGSYALVGRFVAPTFGTYIASLYMTNGARHDIIVVATSSGVTARKIDGDTSSLELVADSEGRAFSLYAKFNTSWSFMPVEAFSGLVKIGIFPGVSDPIIRNS